MVSPAEPQKKGSLAILEEGDRATPATRHAEISDEPATYLTPQEELENTSKGSASTPSTKEGDASSEGAVPGAALGEKDSSAADLRYRKRQIGRENTQGEGLGGPYAGPPRRATQISTTSSGEPRMGITRTFTQLLQPEHRLAPAPNTYHSLLNILKYSWLNVLLVFIPVSWALHFALPASTTNDVVIFVTSCKYRGGARRESIHADKRRSHFQSSPSSRLRHFSHSVPRRSPFAWERRSAV